ncbi:MAG: helix-turn-helix domain-containing protein [Coriobacteriia bacterium]|nr:helix-turn-helix domain-containing protein [Coriobacteriia bacterium]
MSQLGDTLRERRIALGITIEQAEDRTKIRGKLLDALESGDYAKLPNPGYVRGYISSYARLLELDSVPLLAMYRAETGSSRFHDIAPPDTAVSARGEQHEVPWKVGVIAVAILVVLSLVIWLVLRVRSGPESPPPIPTTPTVEATGATPSAEDPGEQSPAADPAEKPPATYTPFTLKIKVATNGASWVEVRVDGKSAYVGSLTSGRTKSFEVTSKAVVKIGKPSVVTVYRDGKKVDVPNSGGTPTLTLTADPAP